MTNNEGTTMTERERMTTVLESLLGQLGVMAGWDLTMPGNASTAQMLASALESLVTARAMLGEEAASPAGEPDQLTTLRRWLVDRDARIRELEGHVAEQRAIVERIAKDRDALIVRNNALEAQPRFPGLTQEQAKLLKRTVHNTLTGEACDDTGPVGELCRCSVAEPVAHDPCAELRAALAALAAMVRRIRATGGYSTPEQQAEFRAAVRLLEAC